MTTLILVRHAKPADLHEYPTDLERPLVDEGRVVQREMAERLKAAGWIPGHILTSPAVRARQSAEILGEVMDAPVTEENGLGVDFDVDAVLAAVGQGTTLLVGHIPTLPMLVNLLVGEEVLDTMAKSGAAVITFSGKPLPAAGKLVAYLKPD